MTPGRVKILATDHEVDDGAMHCVIVECRMRDEGYAPEDREKYDPDNAAHS
jgi:hypothetical protein